MTGQEVLNPHRDLGCVHFKREMPRFLQMHFNILQVIAVRVGASNGEHRNKFSPSDQRHYPPPAPVDSRFYQDLDHGYAATVYKAQGVTVDRSYVLATNHFDRHSSYVALSRHRDEARVFYAAEDFADPRSVEATSTEHARHRFLNALSRARPKELAHDYLDRIRR
jgi:ATP-dependent exoDNAse (exonuclease V) alpha subunit